MLRTLRLLSPALSVALLALAAGAVAQTPSDEGGVRPGDKVNIDFYTGVGTRVVELSGEQTVSREGHIYLPFAGEVTVVGLDAEGIRQQVVEELSRFFENPVAMVTVQLRVNVTGAVRAPGHYFMDPSSTVIDALARAGGIVSQLGAFGGIVADPSSVRLIRDGKTRILDLRPEAADERITTLRIQSGDWIHVPEAQFSRWRDNLQLLSSIVTIVTSIALIVTR